MFCSKLVRALHRYPVVLVLCLFTLGTGLSSCEMLWKSGIGTTSIEQVNRNPRDKKEVTIRGKVVNQFAVLGRGIYELKDDTGSIWILTDKGMPKMNSSIAVKGQPQEGLSFAGQNFAVSLNELGRFE